MIDAEWAVGRGRAVIDLVREEEITFLAAAIAYFGFVSILPALLLAVAIASAVGGESLVEAVLAGSEEFLTAAGRDALSEALTSGRGRSGATIIGGAILAWTALRVFKGLDIAFSRVYGTSGVDSFVSRIRDALVVLTTIGVSLWGMLLMGGLLATYLPIGGDSLGLFALLVGLSIVFLPLYVVFPDAEVSMLEAAPGAIFAAIGWVALQAGFQVYAANAQQFTVYGVIGGILLLVTWFYLAAILLLVGAALNRVLGDQPDGSDASNSSR